MNTEHTPQQAWAAEQSYFDSLAASAREFNLDRIADRYEQAMGHPLYPLEVAYQMLGDLRGKRVLDVGCGLGENSLIFARWGAQVTGVDISAGALGVAQRRADQAGLSGNLRFLNTPFELLSSEQPFDVVWCAAFLHHVLDRLPEVCAIIRRLVTDDGFVLFSEPVRLSSMIKTLRSWVPLSAAGTPDERPLEPADMRVIEATFDIEGQQMFGPVSRLQRLTLPGTYEGAGTARRYLTNSLYRIDRRLMSLGMYERTAMVMNARLRPRRSRPT
jgi:2-polyprenyl-3-methyl-5-hydroxy-6-metoxy-1,4-benzoquinol methylase